MSYFFNSFEMERQEMVPGITLRTKWGDNVMLSLVDVEPNTVMDEHHHPHEQAGIMLQGEFDMTIGGETRRLRPGDGYMIPGGVPHSLRSFEGWALALDIFSPPRDEYKK